MTTLSLNATDIRDLMAVDRKLRSLPGNYCFGIYHVNVDCSERIMLNGAFPKYYLSRDKEGFLIWTWDMDDHLAISPVEKFSTTTFFDALIRLVELNADLDIRNEISW